MIETTFGQQPVKTLPGHWRRGDSDESAMSFFLIMEHKNAINYKDIVFSGFSALIIWAVGSGGLCIAFIPLSALSNQQVKSMVPVEKQAPVFSMGLNFARMRVSNQALTMKL